MAAVPRPGVQAAPRGVPCARRVTRSAPCGTQAHVPSQGGCALEPRRDGPRQCRRQDGAGVACLRLFLHAGPGRLAWGLVPQAHHGSCGQGPRERGVAAWRARGPAALARRGWRPLDPATRRGAVLPPWEAVKGMEVVGQPEPEDLSHARPGGQQVQGGGSVWRRGGAEGACQSTAPLLILGAQGHVAREGLVPRGLVKALGDTRAVGFGGDVLARRGPGLLPRRRRPMGQPCSALAPQGGAATAAGPGSAPVGGRDSGLGEQAAPKQGRHLLGIDRVGCGLAAMPGLHGEGMPRHAGETFGRPQGREPLPGDETRDGPSPTGTRRCDGREERCRSGWPMTVQQHVALVVHATDVHAPGRHGDTAGKGRLMGGESPGRSYVGGQGTRTVLVLSS